MATCTLLCESVVRLQFEPADRREQMAKPIARLYQYSRPFRPGLCPTATGGRSVAWVPRVATYRRCSTSQDFEPSAGVRQTIRKPLSGQRQRGVPLGGWSRSRGDAAATAVQDATAMARRAKR